MDALRRRVERPEALVLAAALSGLAAYGWLAPPFWVAVTIAIQLALGGFGTVWLIGAAQPRLGYARYATPAVAAVSLTLAGRLVGGPLQLVVLPLAIVLIFGVVWAELQVAAGRTPRLTVDLSLVGIVFAAAAGVAGLFPKLSWPPALMGGTASKRSRRLGCTCWPLGSWGRCWPCCHSPAWWGRPSWRSASTPGRGPPRRSTTAPAPGRW
ncbi:MAG: hypothetical protein E6J47_05345 [Chloroflexi bacterium]|nr:MAG: hypothetical protein E6J47_05345 [Chloroflexota bacterium]